MKPVLYTTGKKEPIFLGEIFYFITANNMSSYCDTIRDGYKGHECGYNFKTNEACQEYIDNNLN